MSDFADSFDLDAEDASEEQETRAPEAPESSQPAPSEDPHAAASVEQETVTVVPTGNADYVSVAVGGTVDLTEGAIDLPADQAALVVETGAAEVAE